MNLIGLIFRKEIMNAVRDWRVLFSTVIIPLLVLPVVTMLPMMLIGKQEREAREKPSTVAVFGVPYSELSQTLRQSGRFFVVTVQDPALDIRRNHLDVAVDVESLSAGRTSARVQVLYDATRTDSRAAADKVKLVLGDLSHQILMGEIDTTRVNLNPVAIETTNVASDQEMSGFFLGIIAGIMAIVGLISGSMAVAIDSTAGEKERKTLEVLLAAPIDRRQIVLGKYLATLVTGMVSVILLTTGYTLSLLVGLRALGSGSDMGFGNFGIPLYVVPIILLVMLCVAGFVAAFELTIAVFARGYREAQTYLSPLTIIAIVPVIFMQTMPSSPPAELFYIPLLNAMLLIRELLMGSIVAGHIINTIASSLIFSAVALRLAFAMFKRESVLLR